MDIRKLQRAVVDALEDVKAQDIKVFNTTSQTSLFDRVIIASGTSNRQTRALASSVEDKARELGIKMIAREGDETGEWMLVDLGDIVVHIMQPAIREYYNLEELWGSTPVQMKIGPEVSSKNGRSTIKTVAKKAAKKSAKKAATKRTVKAATKTVAEAPADMAVKAVAKKVVAKKAATKVASKAVKKAVAKKVSKSAAEVVDASPAQTAAPKPRARKTPSQAS